MKVTSTHRPLRPPAKSPTRCLLERSYLTFRHLLSEVADFCSSVSIRTCSQTQISWHYTINILNKAYELPCKPRVCWILSSNILQYHKARWGLQLLRYLCSLITLMKIKTQFWHNFAVNVTTILHASEQTQEIFWSTSTSKHHGHIYRVPCILSSRFSPTTGTYENQKTQFR